MSRAWFALAVVAVLGLFYVGYGLQGGSPSLENAAYGQVGGGRGGGGFNETPGRFQMAATGGAAPYVFVCDTHTSHCWAMSFAAAVPEKWTDLSSPVPARGGRGRGAPGGDAPLLPPADFAPKLPPAKAP